MGLVGVGIVAAGCTLSALAKLRDVARTDAGWGGAFILYAVADATLLFFFFVLVLDNQLS